MCAGAWWGSDPGAFDLHRLPSAADMDAAKNDHYCCDLPTAAERDDVWKLYPGNDKTA